MSFNQQTFVGSMESLRKVLDQAFSPETAAPGYENPTGSTGQCAAVAIMLYGMYGGDLVSAKIEGHSHWFNKLYINGYLFYVDLTGDQFGYPEVQISRLPLYPGTRVRKPQELKLETILRAIKLAERAGFPETTANLRRFLEEMIRAQETVTQDEKQQPKETENKMGRRYAAEGWLMLVLDELARAYKKHPRPQASLHEGYAVLKEEVDELWDEVKAQAGQERDEAVQDEAIQVAAMAVRLLIDAFGDPPKEKIPGITIGERVRLIEQMLAEIGTVTNEIERGVATNPFRRIRDALFRARYNLEAIFGGEES